MLPIRFGFHLPAAPSSNSSRDGNLALLQRLTQHFQGLSLELRQLVEKQDAVMGQRYFSRCGRAAAADHAGIGE